MSSTFLLTFLFFFIFGCWVWWRLLYLIPIRQAWISLSRFSGQAGQVYVGPGLICLWPWQKVHPIDLAPQGFSLKGEDMVTADLAVVTRLDVFYAFDPILLQASDLDRIVPMFNKINSFVQAWAEYILRSLISGWSTAELLGHSACRHRLEKQLRHTLQTRVQPFGLRIYTVRLTCQPTPAMLRAQLAASQIQVEAEARAQALARLMNKLGPDHDLGQLLTLELLQMAQEGDSPLLATLNLPFLGSGNHS
jgi:regulator of protease activity HflC (stomatin/prohibitin superfamily)